MFLNLYLDITATFYIQQANLIPNIKKLFSYYFIKYWMIGWNIVETPVYRWFVQPAVQIVARCRTLTQSKLIRYIAYLNSNNSQIQFDYFFSINK